jgi:hypothetical protein
MKKYLFSFLAIVTVAFGALAFVPAEAEPVMEEAALQWWCHNTFLGHACTSRLPPGGEGWCAAKNHTGQGKMQDHDSPCD